MPGCRLRHAALGIDEIRYATPVVVDETNHMEVTVSELRPTPNGSAMFCRLDDVMRNQRGDIVLTMHRMHLLKVWRTTTGPTEQRDGLGEDGLCHC